MAKTNLRLFRKDMLVREVGDNRFMAERSLIHVVDNDKTAPEKKIRFYEVLVTGPNCKTVKIGDTIALSWLDTMPSFELNGEKVTVTDETKVIGICDI